MLFTERAMQQQRKTCWHVVGLVAPKPQRRDKLEPCVLSTFPRVARAGEGVYVARAGRTCRGDTEWVSVPPGASKASSHVWVLMIGTFIRKPPPNPPQPPTQPPNGLKKKREMLITKKKIKSAEIRAYFLY